MLVTTSLVCTRRPGAKAAAPSDTMIGCDRFFGRSISIAIVLSVSDNRCCMASQLLSASASSLRVPALAIKRSTSSFTREMGGENFVVDYCPKWWMVCVK